MEDRRPQTADDKKNNAETERGKGLGLGDDERKVAEDFTSQKCEFYGKD